LAADNLTAYEKKHKKKEASEGEVNSAEDINQEIIRNLTLSKKKSEKDVEKPVPQENPERGN